MVICRTNIELGKYIYPYICEVKIESSWKTLTDTCTISLPKLTTHKQSGLAAQSLIHVGDEAVVSFGYEDRLHERFRGFVMAIKPNMPMEFNCEDKMWELKRKSVANKSWRAGVKVKDVLEYIGLQPNEYELIGNRNHFFKQDDIILFMNDGGSPTSVTHLISKGDADSGWHDVTTYGTGAAGFMPIPVRYKREGNSVIVDGTATFTMGFGGNRSIIILFV